VSSFRHALDVYRGYRVPRFQLIEHRNRGFAFSAILIVLSLAGLAFVRLNFSIDFEGGAQISYPTTQAVVIGEVQTTLEDAGLTGSEVQIVSGNQVSIRTQSLTGVADSQKLIGELAGQAGISPDDVNVEDIGPTWGSQISQKALRGLVIVLLAIGAYIALRFEWKMAVGAMIALVHDVLITAGIYALTGREVTPETVIAILTILGFSLYDTVVIYDKVKENSESPGMMARLGYDAVVNESLNHTLMRSVNTSLVVLLPILSLLLFGGSTLKDFAFAMFVGVAIGAYSSIFIAAPVLTIIHHRVTRRRPPVRRGSTLAGVPRPQVKQRAETESATVAAASDAAAVRATARSGGGSRPRPKSKRRPPAKRKRR
jgi:preprotein translocase subunit SecF